MQAREFSSELRAGSKASKSSTPLFEGPASANQSISITDTTADAYYKMITVFIPLLVDEVSFVWCNFCEFYSAKCSFVYNSIFSWWISMM